MTIPYNVSHQKIIEYLQENFVYCNNDEQLLVNKWCYFKDGISIKLKDSDFPILAKGLKEVLGDDRFKIKNLLEYLKNIAKVCVKLGLFIPWTTPTSGILLKQSYLALKEERLKVFSYTKKTFSIKVPDKLNFFKSRQVCAFMPNLIHYLDAAALSLLVYYYFSGKRCNTKSIYTIHNCFAVTANNVDNIVDYLKLGYQKIYSEKNYLRELDKEMRQHINLSYREAFDGAKLIIKTDNGNVKYPSIETVLGLDSNASGLIMDSFYIAH